jgi:ferritin-like metal-binding protein YciE
MAKAARNPDLKNAFIEHLEQTKGHLERLKQVAEKLGKRLAGHTCAAMKGLRSPISCRNHARIRV